MSTVEVVIEISRGSRNKYELDEVTGGLRLDRVLFSSVHYPEPAFVRAPHLRRIRRLRARQRTGMRRRAIDEVEPQPTSTPELQLPSTGLAGGDNDRTLRSGILIAAISALGLALVAFAGARLLARSRFR